MGHLQPVKLDVIFDPPFLVGINDCVQRNRHRIARREFVARHFHDVQESADIAVKTFGDLPHKLGN